MTGDGFYQPIQMLTLGFPWSTNRFMDDICKPKVLKYKILWILQLFQLQPVHVGSNRSAKVLHQRNGHQQQQRHPDPSAGGNPAALAPESCREPEGREGGADPQQLTQEEHLVTEAGTRHEKGAAELQLFKGDGFIIYLSIYVLKS